MTAHHLVCRRCGRELDVECDPPPPTEAGGFVIEEAAVTFRGLCPACRGARREA